VKPSRNQNKAVSLPLVRFCFLFIFFVKIVPKHRENVSNDFVKNPFTYGALLRTEPAHGVNMFGRRNGNKRRSIVASYINYKGI